MTRLPGHLAACIAFGLLTASAQASDIVCKTTLRPSHCDDPLAADASCLQSVPRAANLICDHAMLHLEHERIHADQQRQLRAGAIDGGDIAAWRKRRDACTSVTCLDRVFASWRQHPGKKPPLRAAAPQPAPPDVPAREVPSYKQPAVAAKVEPLRLPAAQPPVTRPPATQPAVAQPAAELPPAQPSSRPSAEPAMQERPVGIRRVQHPTPQQAAIRPMLEPRPSGWASLGTLAWLGMCSAGIACWSRRMRGEWLPGVTRLRERTRDAPPVVLVVSGLLALNGVLLLCILTASRPLP